MSELMGAFKKSDEAGQAKWQKTRKAVLRRRAEAEAMHKAQGVEAKALKTYTGQRRRTAPLVASWAEQTYGEREV
jgi:hypothetical protein